MAASGRALFVLEQVSEVASASAFVRTSASVSGFWRVATASSGSGGSVHSLVDAVLAELNKDVQAGSAEQEQLALAVDHSDGAVHVPTSLASFAARPHLPTLFLPSLIQKSLENNKEALKHGLALIARGCFFSNAAAFEKLESLVDDLNKSSKVEVMAVEFSGTSFPVDSPFIQALHEATSLPLSSCVALGTVKEAEVARALGLCPPALVGRLSRLLKELSLPSKFDRGTIDTTAVRLALKKHLYSKGRAGLVQCSLPTGSFKLEDPFSVKVEVIERVVADAVTVVPFKSESSNRSCSVRVPGSKSVSNRALLLAGLSEGTCTVRGLLHSDDTQVMMGALEQLGAQFTWIDNGAALKVVGNGGKFAKPTKPLWMGNAGTATRFVISLCTLVPDEKHETIMEGSHRMEERPQGDLVDALVQNGCVIKHGKKPGRLPLIIRGGGFKGGKMTLSGKISSQFVSSVLFASPYAKEPLELTLLEAEPTSISYIEMTLETMAEFGVKVERLAKNAFRVPNTRGYIAPEEYIVEADASSATYALACASVYPGRAVTVLGVGSNSLQGDAQFCQFLGRMGAQVTQTKDSSTVTGTDSLHPPHEEGKSEDMASLTDAFLTGVACAALCPSGNTTHISGIENQHVKECDRIAALVKELGKLGISCDDLPDGIIVRGVGAKFVPARETYLDTYDDHRVAMSLAVLGTRMPNLVIADKDCTDKTYPDFWDDLVNKLKTRVNAWPRLPQTWQEQSLVLVGMRGAGKTTLGKRAAAHLGWTLIDLDEQLCKKAKLPTCREIVEKLGWAGFRNLEFEVLVETLALNPIRHVIACGGGVVEKAESREKLREWFPVVNITRDFADIELVLNKPQAAAEPQVKRVKQSEGQQRDDDPNRPRFDEPIDQVWARRKPWLQQVSTYDFVVPRSGSIEKLTEDWPIIESDFVRLLDNARKVPTPDCFLHDPTISYVLEIDPAAHPDSDAVQWALALARRNNPERMIAIKLSSEAQISLEVDQQIDLLVAAGRTGCEGLILPAKRAWGKTCATLRSRVLSSFGPVRVDTEDEFSESEREGFRRVVEAYPEKALVQAPAKKMYYLFGHPIYASPSPTLHNTAFGLLQHSRAAKRYCLFDSSDVARCNTVLHSPLFGGASVTIPHKQAIEGLNVISREAKAIGAINTIVRGPNGLLGDNTDWLGIRQCLVKQGGIKPGSKGIALVVGAGGTARAACFCVKDLGLELVVFNRTSSKAEELAKECGGRVVRSASEELPNLVAIVSTVPASSNWTAPDAWLAPKPFVLDVAYKPRRTALLKQAEAKGCATGEGIDMLIEQGLEQVKRFESESIDREKLGRIELSPEMCKEIERRVHEFYNQ